MSDARSPPARSLPSRLVTHRHCTRADSSRRTSFESTRFEGPANNVGRSWSSTSALGPSSDGTVSRISTTLDIVPLGRKKTGDVQKSDQQGGGRAWHGHAYGGESPPHARIPLSMQDSHRAASFAERWRTTRRVTSPVEVAHLLRLAKRSRRAHN
jgi:hypothetical protein